MTDPFHVQLGRVHGGGEQPVKADRTLKPVPGPSFIEMLEQVQGVRFSNHALKRLQSRAIHLDSENVNRLSEAIDKAEKRGGKSSLVMVDDLAFIVNVQDRIVVTALDANQRGEGVFTRIDSVVFADPKSSIDVKG
ncbi:MAG: flagellar biosynthesis protein [Chloroflexi bacterium]|nr:flagellar biosynthesis protein [Chloroflexota bacterium]